MRTGCMRTALFSVFVMIMIGISPVIPISENVTAASPPPDDGINGFQIIDGDWHVYGQQNYTDEEIELNGNLIIHTGAILKFRNVTLSMNITSPLTFYSIDVSSGASFLIYDGDDDPVTENDASNITDSIYDYDNLQANNSDYRYYFRVQQNGVLEVKNSNIREVGSKSGQTNADRGIYTDSAWITVTNSTFSNCYYAFYSLNDPDPGNNSFIIDNSTFSRSHYGLYLNQMDHVVIKFSYFYNMMYRSIQYFNIKHSNLLNTTFYNQTLVEAIIYSEYVSDFFISGCLFNVTKQRAMLLYYSERLLVQNNTFRKIGHDCIYNSASYRSYFVFKHNYFDGTPQMAIYTNRAYDVYYLENYFNNTRYAIRQYAVEDSDIKNNTFRNYTYRAIDFDRCIRNTIRDNYFNGTTGSDWAIVQYNAKIAKVINNTLDKPRYGMYTNYGDGPNEFRDNKINGRGTGLSAYGIYIYRCGRNTLRDNVVSDVDNGIFAYESSYYYNSIPMNVYGGNITNTINSFYLQYRSYINAYNVSFNASKIYVYSASYNPYINVYHDVDVRVSDNTGRIGGALLNITNATGLLSYTGHSPGSGLVRFNVLNGTYRYNSKEYFGPFNVSANVSGKIGYSGKDNIINSYRVFHINYSGDIPPSSPINLRYGINGSNVQLFWESYENDLSSYRIMRRTEFNTWAEVHNITSPAPGVNKIWQDLGNSTDLVEYHYKIYHMDSLGQEGVNDIFIVFDDWVFTNKTIFKDVNMTLNGSLVVEAAGELELVNVSLSLNEQVPVENDMIEIRAGGKLILRDGDNDPATTGDATGINVTPTMEPYSYGFIVKAGGELEMHNSQISNASNYIESLDSSSNIFADGGTLRIYNSSMTMNDISIYMESSNGGMIYGNDFKDDLGERFDVALRMDDSSNITVSNNIFRRSLAAEVYVYEGNNITIRSNDFQCENVTSIRSIYTGNITIENNTLHRSQRAIHLSQIDGGSITGNDLYDYKGEGILIYQDKNVEISNNILHESFFGDYGIYLNGSSEIMIGSNQIDKVGNLERGIYGFDVINVTLDGNEIVNTYIGIQFVETEPENGVILITNNKIHDAPSTGFGLYLTASSGFSVINNIINDVHYGIYQTSSSDSTFRGNSIYNITYGVFQLGGAANLFHEETMWESQYSYYFLSGAGATVYNCTILGLPLETIYVNSSSNIILTNPYFYLSKINISDSTCSITLKWAFDLIVYDQFGQPQKDIFVRTRNAQGTIQFDKYTDALGKLTCITLTTKILYRTSNVSYMPHLFEAKLGNHEGDLSVSLTSAATVHMYLDNKGPTAYNIMIDPLTPRTNDDLKLTYLFSDPESDTNSGTIIKWYKNNAHMVSLDGLTTIDHSITTKGNLWYCKITPYDGASYGPTSTSTYAWIINTRPGVTDVVLKPQTPNSLEDLWVNYTYHDDDGDLETGTIFRWYVKSGSNFILKEVTNIPVLDHTKTNKGEEFQVRIEPRDGESFGAITNSNLIQVGNTPPTVENATITPSSPTSSDDITVVYDFKDMDGDPEGATIFKWYKVLPGGTDFIEYSSFDGRTVLESALIKGERWLCMITPYDGNDLGEPVNSTEVVIENTAPVVSNLKILPTAPMTYNDLDVDFDYSDYDGDPEQDTSFEWLKWSETGQAFLKTGLNLKRLPSVFTKRDEIWLCELTPKDSFTFGTSVRSEPVVIGNSRPSSINLQITPELPRTLDDLTANYDYFDDNNDPESGSLIYWYKNGEQQTELNNLKAVDHTLTLKGERWYFAVVPGDGFISGIQRTSAELEIFNSQPEVRSPRITNLFPRGDEDLEISFEYFDPDGDDNNRTVIKWYRDGEHQALYNDLHTIPATATEKDQSWYYEIWVYDGLEISDANQSYPVTIRNSMPVISSYLPVADHLFLNETEKHGFSVDVIDFDGDVLFYQWLIKDLTRPGTITAGEDSVFTFTTDFTSAGEYIINITVQDWGVNSFKIYKEWRVSVANKNREPVITFTIPEEENPRIDIGEPLKFAVTAIDEDADDVLSIKWLFDGHEVEAAAGLTTYTFDPDEADVGKHAVTVIVNDTIDETARTWNVTVKSSNEGSRLFYGLTWDQWSVFIQVIVITATAILGVVGFRRLRKKKGVLQDYMKKIDAPMKSWQEDPDKTERELIDVEEVIDGDYRSGSIEDIHYFLIDRQLKENLREIRQNRIDEKFEYLPPEVSSEISKILEDGKITDTEYRTFVDMLEHSRGMGKGDKVDVKELMMFWRDVDKDRVERRAVSKPGKKEWKKKKKK